MGASTAVAKQTSFQTDGKQQKRGQRRRYTKTKFGCRTCKIRKVRCDETWPLCNNCRRTGRQCDGVAQTAAKSKNDVTFIKPLTLSHFESLQPAESYAEEFESVDHVCSRLVHCIAKEFGRPCWKPIIFHTSIEEPSLSSASTAFCALCGQYRGTKSAMASLDASMPAIKPKVRDAIFDYEKRIQKQREQTTSVCDRSMNVVVIRLVICVFFELLMNNLQTALSHLQHISSILACNKYAVDRDLALALTRLELQAANLLTFGQQFSTSRSLGDTSPAPNRSFIELESEVTYLVGTVFSFLRNKADQYRYGSPGSILPDILIEASTLESQLHHFSGRIDQMKSLSSSSAAISPIEEAHLRMRTLTGVILVATSLYAEESIYDRFMRDFLIIVDCAATLLGNIPVTNVVEDPDLTLEPGIFYPLYLTACKCRASNVRRRAISLLYEVSKLGGARDAYLYAQVGQRVMQLEEACSDEEQPTDSKEVAVAVAVAVEGFRRQDATSSSARNRYQRLCDTVSPRRKTRTLYIPYSFATGLSHSPRI
ncbi:uncharacterized protein UV8b_00085 [Ustilaginoidea virens]|uniref:Zn(2)-C6 fungal-type domain-containing protein n=1 Tax=Ustilaginoidea virens TaxID=1159556 RepID=A0A8E5HI42_USTVR|nr:uncharacterized protein UV8b_00085 [Ustilaginoidea virens]QUC15844.1 hypothetical protein UV8b_00085 [Ustilaginoidea virens]